VSANVFLTGPPRVGKSTALKEAASRLREQGITVGGVKSPDVRDSQGRVGFRFVDVATGEDAILAHVDREKGPKVGKYRVNVDGVDRVSERAFDRVLDEVDVALIDEVAPMELYSDVFVAKVREVLEADVSVIGTVHQRSSKGLIGEVKRRNDAAVLKITETNRDAMPGQLVNRVLDPPDPKD
jgi:nucleoside-triphosphatase